jgi:hypothetical protein
MHQCWAKSLVTLESSRRKPQLVRPVIILLLITIWWSMCTINVALGALNDRLPLE